MSPITQKYEAVLAGCSVLEREIELAIRDGQPVRAWEGLSSLHTLSFDWVYTSLGLLASLENNAYYTQVNILENYCDDFQAYFDYACEKRHEINQQEQI